MADWNLSLFLEPRGSEPVYRQIALALSHEVQRGRLRPGDPLPGYRSLADQLGVSRNTAMAALQELQVQGWVVSRSGSGSEVASELPIAPMPLAGKRQAPATCSRETIGFDLAPDGRSSSPLDRPGEGDGAPDPRLLPAGLLARAYRRALAATHESPRVLEDAQGHPRLRRALAAMLAGSRGIAASPEQILVTRGSQNALFLIAQALIAPGDVVAVERLGPRRAWDVLSRAGGRVLPIPVDAEGIDVDALAAAATATRLRAVLVTPHRQYPTLVGLSAARGARLLKLAAERRFAVLEVVPDFELQFESPTAAPLAAQDVDGVVVHIGSLSDLLTPTIRLGLVHGPPPLLERMKALRAELDRQGDLALELAMAELMEDGELQGHTVRTNRIYRQRRDALCAALTHELGGAAQFPAPAGGLALWATVAPEIDVDAWAARAQKLGVAVRPGRSFDFDGAAVQGLRVGFSTIEEGEAHDTARRLARALVP